VTHKLKVGVITMHRVVNYGSFLQAYATQKVIESLGMLCEIIDYKFPNSLHRKKIDFKKILSELPISRTQKMKRYFLKLLKKHLNLSNFFSDTNSIHSNPPLYDVYITGSDQTLNPKHTQNDSTFLLSFAPENKTKIMFSASFSENNLNVYIEKLFINNLNKYDAISLREPSTYLEEKLKKRIEITLDPTLLIEKDTWVKNFPYIQKEKEPYILLYMLSYSFDPSPYIYNLLKYLQKKTELKVLSLSNIPKKYDIKHKNLRGCSVNDFIGLFDKASYIITSSFHGTAFSLTFCKPLFSIIPDCKKDCRQVSLLNLLGCSNCAIQINTPFEKTNPFYDIKKMQDVLHQQREKSVQYLKNSIKEKICLS